VLAARQLGIVKIPVMVAAGWTEAQKRAYVLADNQLAITGSGWDPELLFRRLATPRVKARPTQRSAGGLDCVEPDGHIRRAANTGWLPHNASVDARSTASPRC
jgi:hypothetical protein